MVQVQERIEPIAQPEPRTPPVVEPSAPSRAWLPFVLIVAAGFILRMWDLGARAMHHDESLHAVYGWYLFTGRGYTHDPMMHGPFMFHITALMYFLFGDSEVSFRLSLVLLSTVAIALMYFMRHELGRYGSIAAALMLAIGPLFLYFSRFGHNEAFLLFQELLVVVGMFGWLRTRKSAYLYAVAVALGLMFATKMTWVLFGLTCATFVTAAVILERRRSDGLRPVLEAVKDVGWRRFGICVGIVLGIGVVLYSTFFTNLEGLCTALYSPPIGSCAGKQGMIQYWMAQQNVARGSQPWFYYALLLPLYAVVPLTLAAASAFLAPKPRSLFFWFAAWWALSSILMYSYASEKMPWLVVHLATPLVMLGALSVEGVSRHFSRPWGLTPRQWAVGGLTLLAFAAFVAWASLGVPPGSSPLATQAIVLRKVALGLVVAGFVVAALKVAFSLTPRRALGAVASVVMGVLGLYSVHTAFQAVYKNGDVPVEMLVYVQSSPDTPFITSEVERISNQLGLRKDMPILLDGGYTETVGGQQVEHEAVSWPFEWYLRDYKAKQYYTKTFPSDFTKYPVILIMGTSLDPVRDQLSGYTGNKFRLNWWYPEDYKQLTWEGVAYTLWDPEARLKFMKYVIYKELINPPLGARELWFYVRNDLVGKDSTVVANTVGASDQSVAQRPGGVPSIPVGQSLTVFGRGAAPGQNLLQQPKGVAVSPDGHVYVADSGSSTIKVFNPDGTVATMWGSKGAGDGQFNEPWGIAVGPDSAVYVADTWNHRVQKFDAGGRFLAKWGTGEMGTEPARFYGPRDIAVSPNGQVLVTDTGNKRIQVFDQNGTFVRAFGTEGTGLGQFQEPVGITVDSQGKIYVADTWNERIQVFDSNFQSLGQHSVTGWSSKSLTNKPYVAVAPDGTIYATRPDQKSVLRVKDGLVATLSLPSNPSVGLPTGIRVSRDGQLLVGDSQNNIVVAYDLGTGTSRGASESVSAEP